jgi:hypothetical protein
VCCALVTRWADVFGRVVRENVVIRAGEERIEVSWRGEVMTG